MVPSASSQSSSEMIKCLFVGDRDFDLDLMDKTCIAEESTALFILGFFGEEDPAVVLCFVGDPDFVGRPTCSNMTSRSG